MIPIALDDRFLKQLELLKLRARRSFLGTRQGGHLSLKRGHGMEFSDYRKYELGDNPRHIDWGVYARSDRLYVKRFQEEKDISVVIILDTSASMCTPADEGKWEMGRNLAIALSYIGLMEQDSVSLSALGELLTPSYYGGRAIHQLMLQVSKVNPGRNIDLQKEIALLATRLRHPGIAIFISDFLFPFENIERCFNTLRAKNLDITAIQLLSPSDILPMRERSEATVVDSETGEQFSIGMDDVSRKEYQYLLQTHNQRLKNFLYQSRIGYAQISSDQSLEDVVLKNLTLTGLLK